MRTIKQSTKRELTELINGGTPEKRVVIYMKKPDGSLIFYGAWPPIPGMKPGDPVPETLEKLSVTADIEETAETFLKLRGKRPVIPGNVI